MRWVVFVVAAQFRLYLLQLIKRRHVVAQFQPAMGGLEVVAVGWGEGVHYLMRLRYQTYSSSWTANG